MRMKLKWLMIALLLIASPALAQSETIQNYEFEDTGTSIDYPASWDGELVDGIFIVRDVNQSQVLVLDYPVIASIGDESDDIPIVAVQELVLLLTEEEIPTDDIYQFSLDGRDIYAYDIELTLSASVYVIQFTNETFGALISIEIDDEIENQMLLSFDNSNPPATDVAVATGQSSFPREDPAVFLFDSDQRFFIPAGWVIELREREDGQYAILSVPDDDVTVWLFDVSPSVTKGTDLDQVLDDSAINWEADFGIVVTSDIEAYSLGDRDAISYTATIDETEGYVVVLRYSDENIGVAVVSGEDTANYDLQIEQLIGSFNNLGAVLDYLN